MSVTKSGGGQAPQIVLTLTQFILTNLLTPSMTSAGLAENQQAWPVNLLTLLSTEQYASMFRRFAKIRHITAVPRT